MYYLVAVNRVFGKSQDFLTYQSDDKLEIGQIVLVSVGKQKLAGVIFGVAEKPDFETKPILEIIEPIPLPEHLLSASKWLVKYYCSPMANVIQSLLPTGITKKRRIKSEFEKVKKIEIKPSDEQKMAIDKIINSKSQTHLLYGVTGTGKTTVYLETIKQILAQNKSALIIIPEIALTSQVIEQFSRYFDNLIVQHSELTESVRHQNWQKCLNSSEPIVVIGTRSALFMPIKNLGIIVIDEAHELNSLKNNTQPKYLASRLASRISSDLKIPLVLGSATPDISDYWLAEQKSSSIIKLTKKPIKTKKPIIEVVDMKKSANFGKHYFLSNQLLASIKKSLNNNEQALLFHNRRGSASVGICQNCGFVSECPNCHIPMTLHHDKFEMRCHNCNIKQPVIKKCPDCDSSDIKFKGVGTKLIESEIKKLFPKARVARFDLDTDKHNTIHRVYSELTSGKIDILIGTQVIAKGLNLPKLSTVGIIQADTGLMMPDFNSNQKTFQLITQVLGRIGRNDKSTRAIIQSYRPEHHSVVCGINQNFDNFYKQEIKILKQNIYPPFCFLLKLTISYKTEKACINNSKKLATEIRQNYQKIQIFGPTPSFYEKTGDKFNWQIIIKSKNRKTLQQIAKNLPPNWRYDLDIISLL